METHKDGQQKVRKVRKLTRFLCQEMLYDYVCKALDKERSEAVLEFLKENKDLDIELEQIRYAMGYCEQLSLTKVTDSLVAPVKENKSYFTRLSKQFAWSNWPEFMKWSLEALVVSTVVAGLAIFVPWKQFDILPKTELPAPKLVAGSIKEPKKDAPLVIPESEQADSTPSAKESVAPTKVAGLDKKPNPPETIPSERGDDQVSGGTSDDEESTLEGRASLTDDEQSGGPAKSAFKGELYRAFMSHSDIDRITTEMVEKISVLGGKKAGKVKLGWRKTDGSYFHMTINESNYEEFLAYLRSIGPVRVYKDPHWRVMPKGKIRVILWLEDSSINN